MPDRPGLDDVGEAEPEPADDRGAAVGAHHQQPALGRDPLEGDLLLDRHVVAEDHHVAAGVEGVHRLDERAGARARRPATSAPGSDAQGGGRGARRRARRRRCAGRTAVRRPRARGRRPPGRGRGRRRRRTRSATTMSLGSRGGDRRSPSRSSTSTLSGVAIATWAASTPSMALRRRGSPGGASTESAYAPERSSTCDCSSRAAHAAFSDRERSRGRAGRPTSSPAPDVCPIGEQGRGGGGLGRACRGRRRTPRTPAAPRRAGRSRAGSPTAGWSGRGCADRGVDVVGQAVRSRRCTASQPQSTSSPSGVRPPPLPTPRSSTQRPDRLEGSEVAGRGGRPPHPGAAEDSAEIDPGNANPRIATRRVPARYRVPRST